MHNKPIKLTLTTLYFVHAAIGGVLRQTKNMKTIIKIFLALLTIIFSQHLSAQGMSPVLERILQRTMAADGVLTKEMHQTFWSELAKMGAASEIEQGLKSIEINILLAQEYQKEVWEGAKISFEKKKAIKSKRIIELEKEMPAKSEESLIYPKGSANYRAAVSSYQKQMKVNMENTRLLLEAAALHKPIKSAHGQAVNIDGQLIETVLSNLSSSFQRVKNLLNKNWKPPESIESTEK